MVGLRLVTTTHIVLSHLQEDEELNSALTALFAAAEEGSLAGLKQLLDEREATSGTLSINHPNKVSELIGASSALSINCPTRWANVSIKNGTMMINHLE